MNYPSTDNFENFDGENYESFNAQNDAIFNEKRNLSRRNKFQAKSKKLADSSTFNITVTNNGNKAEIFELFNPLNSIAFQPNNAQYGKVPSAGPAFQPFNLSAIITTVALQSYAASGLFPAYVANPANLMNNRAFFDSSTGDLLYTRDATELYLGFKLDIPPIEKDLMPPVPGGSKLGYIQFQEQPTTLSAGATIAVSCEEVPYERLLKSLTSMIMHVKNVRISTSNTGNYSHSVEIVSFDDFGSSASNSKNPLSDLSPNQFQTNILDFRADFIIDKNQAWYQKIEANSTLRMTFFIDAYRDAGAIWDM